MGSSLGSTTLQLGLVSVPVSINSAASSSESLATLCNGHPEPVRITQPRICTVCDGPPAEVVKGREVAKGQYQVLTADELEQLNEIGEQYKTIQVVVVGDRAQVLDSTIRAGTCYWLGLRDQVGAAGYRLLVETVRKHPAKAFVARLAVRGAVSLFLLEVRGQALFLQRLEWPEAVREAPAVPEMPVDRKHLKLVGDLVAQVAQAWDAAAFADPRQAARDQMLADRQVDGAGLAAVALPPAGDLTAALEASVKAVASKPVKRPAAKRKAS